MKRRAGVIVALAISLLAHALLLGGVEWRWPNATQPELPPMMARLVAPPVSEQPAPVAVEQPAAPKPAARPASNPPPRPRPKPTPVVEPAARSVPAPVAAPAVAAMPSEMQPDMLPQEPIGKVALAGEVMAATAMPVSAAAAGDKRIGEGWPAEGSIVYRVMLSGFDVGEADHEWSHDAHSYRMQVTLRTTGLAAVMRGFHYVQRSVGEFGAQGLRPLRFEVEQQGKRPEAAVFDWAAGRVSIRRGDRERRAADIRSGDQDVLSLWHQIGIVGEGGLPAALTVVSGKDAKAALLEAIGDENLRLPIGQLQTLRLRAQAADGSLTIDIWLARDYGMLPVRIRMVDDQGEILEQRAVRLRLARPVRAEAPGSDGTNAEMVELREQIDPLAGIYGH